MKQSDALFAGYDCIKFENGFLTLWATRNVGPRVIGLSVAGGENLLAELPDAVAVTPAGRIYHFKGGHRLWHAPEDSERTYIPDNTPLTVEPLHDGAIFRQMVEPETGIEKTMTLRLDPNKACVSIEHRLTNRGLWAIPLAAWAITQLRKGGFAILPQATADTGMLPNRQLVLWPYTDITSSNIHIGNRYIFVEATMPSGALKLGWHNPAGWMAYHLDDTLFVKQSDFNPNAEYFDFGSATECYCSSHFLELESLSPKTVLAPNESVTHLETWTLYSDVHLSTDEGDMDAMVAKLGL